MMLFKVIYTEDIPEGFDGTARFWFIKIRPGCRDDAGLFQHELEHVRQFWRFSLFHCLAYNRINWYTKWCEVRAYRKQLLYHPAKDARAKYIEKFAGFIGTKYGLDVTTEEIVKLLS